MQFATENFPKPEDFIRVERKKFSDLITGHVYLVTEVRPISTRFGDALTAQLKDGNGNKFETILPSRVKKEVESMNLSLSSFFIHYRGLKTSKINPRNSYYDFDLMPCFKSS